MAHHWTPQQMLTKIGPDEWTCGDKRETLGWIRRLTIDGRDAFLCVTRQEMIVAGGDTLKDAALEFVKWSQARKRERLA